MSATVDRDNRIIRGVCIAQTGPARGHFHVVKVGDAEIKLQLEADAETLEQIVECASEYDNGVKVCDAPEHEGAPVRRTVGALRNFRMDGDKVLADLHVFDSYEDADSLFEMAEEIPDTFGLSMVSTGKPDVVDGRALIRCREILSVDIVPNGALTPEGLFAAKTAKKDEVVSKFCEAIFSKKTTLQERMNEPTPTPTTPTPAPAAIPTPAAAAPAAPPPAEPIKHFIAQISDALKAAMTTDDLAKQCNAVVMVATGMRELCESLVSLCFGLTGSAYQVPAQISEGDAAGMVAKMAERFQAARKKDGAPAAPPAAIPAAAPVIPTADEIAMKAVALMTQKFNLPAAAIPAAPPAAATPPVETLDTVRAQIAAETDPVKKFNLGIKAAQMRAGK